MRERISDTCCGFQLEKLFATILQFSIIRDHSPERLSALQLHPGALPSMHLCCVSLCCIVLLMEVCSVQCALMLIEVDTSGSMLRKTTCPNWLTVARPPSLYLSWNRQKNVAGKLIYSKNKLKKRPHAPTDFTRVVVIIFFFFLFQVQGWLCKYLTFFSTIFLSQNFDKREALTNVWDSCTSQTQTGQQWFSTILVMGPIISKRVINKVNRCLVSSSWRHSSFSSSSSASLSSSSSSLPSLYTEWASWA